MQSCGQTAKSCLLFVSMAAKKAPERKTHVFLKGDQSYVTVSWRQAGFRAGWKKRRLSCRIAS